MDNISVKLPRIEQIPIKLRDLYERYGYRKYRMAKFEQYDFYREHKSFLKSEGILTFNGPKGKLLALKPDVTMSIAKSVKKDKDYKYFYVENVFRTDGGEYNEINQIGIEYIGGEGEYPAAEVLWLAHETLGVISDKFVLSIGHAGVWNTCFDYLGVKDAQRALLYDKIKSKSMHEVREVLKNAGINAEGEELIIRLASISGKITDAVEELESVTRGLPFDSICKELNGLADALSVVNASERCYLDFSVIGDMTYYNGIVFNGYVEGVSKAVLSGGRYDNLLKSMGKEHKAIGFAVYTEELQRAFNDEQPEEDVRIFIGDLSVSDALFIVKTSVNDGEYTRAVTEVLDA